MTLPVSGGKGWPKQRMVKVVFQSVTWDASCCWGLHPLSGMGMLVFSSLLSFGLGSGVVFSQSSALAFLQSRLR